MRSGITESGLLRRFHIQRNYKFSIP